ncbi:YTH domain-containing protein 1-like [Lolium rigidum]|uniref:YTH domain-containing protein 1-like n=1 Tax=Lolium rigidum TaxID=89674 RepID=UPI001F5CA4F0|nr:YTH domain-containing protein 1-like [Lolium rigidum]
MRWEAAYVELLLGANQKLAELRDSDLDDDSRTCAETPNSKEVGGCAKLNQDAVDHIASDLSAKLRKLKQAYETLSSKKDKEVSALLSEKDSLRSQSDVMQQDYAESSTKASVDELEVLAQKKDVEIDRLQAEAVEAKRSHDNDLSALVSEKNSVQNQLSVMQQDYTKLLKKKKVLTQKKDHEIVIMRSEAIGAKMKVQKMRSLFKEKDDEIQILVESVQKHFKDISETRKRSRSVDPAVTTRGKLKNSNPRQTVEEDYISQTKTVEKDGQGKTTQKRRRASSMSNDCEMIGNDQDFDEQSESDKDGDTQSERDEDGDEQSTSDENSDEQSRSGGDDDDGQSRSDEHSQSGSDKETTNNPILKPPGNHKRKRDAANGKSDSESNV